MAQPADGDRKMKDSEKDARKALSSGTVDASQKHEVLSFKPEHTWPHKLQGFIQGGPRSSAELRPSVMTKIPCTHSITNALQLPPADELCMGTTSDGREQRIIRNNIRAISGSGRERERERKSLKIGKGGRILEEDGGGEKREDK